MIPSEPQEPSPLWMDGWYRFSGQLASPNFGSRPAGATVNLIVLHSISLPPGQYGGDDVQRLFTNQLDWNKHPYFKSIQGMEVSSLKEGQEVEYETSTGRGGRPQAAKVKPIITL